MINNDEQQAYTQLELALAKAKRDSSRLDSLLKLQSNEDFINVITDGILGDYAIELFKAMSTPQNYAAIKDDNYESKLNGIAYIKSCLGYDDDMGFTEGLIHSRGKVAKSNIPQLKLELEEY